MISIIIIGNEILSSRVQDTNLAHMLQKFAAASYPIDEVRIIRDDVPTISETVCALSARSQFVVSTGGVGPTHDDVTLEAYAHAFEQELILHPDLEERIRRYFGDKIKPSSLRMARVPANTNLIDMGPKSWPLIQVANCFVLPGLPEVFVKKFAQVMDCLPEAEPHYYAEVFTSYDESSFAEFLAEKQQAYSVVEIGSYPTYDRSEYAAKVTLKSTDEEKVKALFDELVAWFTDHETLVRTLDPHQVT